MQLPTALHKALVCFRPTTNSVIALSEKAHLYELWNPCRLEAGRRQLREAASEQLLAQLASLAASCQHLQAAVPAELAAAEQLPPLPASLPDGSGTADLVLNVKLGGQRFNAIQSRARISSSSGGGCCAIPGF